MYSNIYDSCLRSGRANVFYVLDAADAVVVNFTAGQANIIPETPLSI